MSEYKKIMWINLYVIPKSEAFKLRSNDEYLKVKKNKDKIQSQFEKYVNDYISLASLGSKIKSSRFGFTTLQNYHAELGINAI